MKNNFKIKFDNLLSKEITGDYCLLDIPNHFNLGDMLILAGELEYLRKNVEHKMKYCSAISNFDKSRISSKDIILLHGGGNFGDVWEEHQIFREKIISTFPQNKIIILPNTIEFKKKKNLERSINNLRNHKNLIIFVRDKTSLQILKSKFKNIKSFLLPDSALCLSIKKKNLEKEGVLLLKRRDRERTTDLNLSIKNYSEKDWPSMNSKIADNMILKTLSLYNKFALIVKLPTLTIYSFKDLRKYIDEAVEEFSKYDLIITDRLHAFILAYLLKINVILIDNNYGKNRRVYETWFKNNNKRYLFLEDKNRINEKINKMYE